MNYAKTEAGQQAFRERSSLFSARQRAAFILFDGVKSVEQVLASTASLGITQPDIEHMVTHGFLKENALQRAPVVAVAPAPPASPAAQPVRTDGTSATKASAAPQPAPSQAAEAVPSRTPQERYSQAKPLATQLTASLGLRGFMLNLGVESASGYDDLLALFPKIQSAVGAKKCEALERVLKD